MQGGARRRRVSRYAHACGFQSAQILQIHWTRGNLPSVSTPASFLVPLSFTDTLNCHHLGTSFFLCPYSYIYRLAQLHKLSGNYVEAAFTLLLHAQLLQWSNSMLKPEGPYFRQSASDRKMALYMDIISYFDKGKVRRLLCLYSGNSILWFSTSKLP